MKWPSGNWLSDSSQARKQMLLFIGSTAVLLAVLAVFGLRPEYRRSRRPAAVKLGQVAGTLLLDGRPAINATVMFLPHQQPDLMGQPPASFGVSDAAGHFTLTVHGHRPGAVVGTHSVTIVRIPLLTEGNRDSEAAARDSQAEIPIPSRYADLTTSGLTVEVKPEDRNEVVLELTSAP